MVADSNLSDGLTASSVAVIAAGGRIVPVSRGNIAIHVRAPAAHVVAPHTNAVDPAAQVIVLAPYLVGFVSEADGATPVADARVEIIDGGLDTGRSNQTRVNGYCFIEHVGMGVPFRLRASKPGYVPSVASHAAIVDGQNGYPQTITLRFRLQKQTSG